MTLHKVRFSPLPKMDLPRSRSAEEAVMNILYTAPLPSPRPTKSNPPPFFFSSHWLLLPAVAPMMQRRQRQLFGVQNPNNCNELERNDSHRLFSSPTQARAERSCAERAGRALVHVRDPHWAWVQHRLARRVPHGDPQPKLDVHCVQQPRRRCQAGMPPARRSCASLSPHPVLLPLLFSDWLD
jgi:hypothetical protein